MTIKTVLLITYRNSQFRDALIASDYSVVDYSLPLTDSDIQELRSLSSFCAVFVEIKTDNIAMVTPLIQSLIEKEVSICALAQVTPAIKNFLLKYGITDLLETDSSESMLNYLHMIDRADNDSDYRGKVLLIDDDRYTKRALNIIIRRYNYEIIPIDTIGELFKAIKGNVVNYILFNIATQSFDAHSFITQGRTHNELRKVPLIAYKNMKEGLFIHEIISGLNHLTRYILSSEELFSILIDIFFREETYPLLKKMIKNLSFDDESLNPASLPGKLFFPTQNGISLTDNIPGIDNLHDMLIDLKKFKDAINKTSSLKWLRINFSQKAANTAGMGG